MMNIKVFLKLLLKIQAHRVSIQKSVKHIFKNNEVFQTRLLFSIE